MSSSSPGRRSTWLVAGVLALALIAGPIVALHFAGPPSGVGDDTPPRPDVSFTNGSGNETPPAPAVEPSHVTLEGATLRVDGEAYPIVQCVRYQPAPPGVSVSWGYRWAHFPENYENDIRLLQELGANTVAVNVRAAAEPAELHRFMDLAHDAGIHVILEVDGPNRQDASRPEVREGFLTNVTRAVENHRDHPALLLWQLGNEVDHAYPNATRLDDWYTLLGEATDRVHELDAHHPVLTANSAATDVGWFLNHSAQVDVYGTNYYGLRAESFKGYLSGVTSQLPNHPILVTEFGVDAWDGNQSRENESAQAQLLVDVWRGISEARAQGEPVLGGCVHEWSDQWWKDGDPESQSPDAGWTPPVHPERLPDGEFNEEYFGLVRVRPDSQERDPRQAYHALAEAWGGSAGES